MNYGMIFYILGMASGFEALFLLLPILVSLIYGESVLSSYLLRDLCIILRGQHTSQAEKDYSVYKRRSGSSCTCMDLVFSIWGSSVYADRRNPEFFRCIF